MKKISGKNRAIYSLNFFERRIIKKAYSILNKLIYNLCTSIYKFEPEKRKALCIRINGNEFLSLDESEYFITMMEDMASVKTISCGFEDEHSI